ncbi:energy-coupling factor transporter transmembrane component T family protein [Martelella soudanensis]|uniref:energy-coupling factor transporter transmembrane component T family protein n=1 Tax=unclassified Martelella TaxID=2629616 RepID=UPI0015DFB9A6|nr:MULTISPECIES: energy-coupling factor transporter transmembrane protein EcfT [unclassified Martelella]
MQSLYIEADSILHRLKPGVKVGGLIVFSLAVFVTENLPVLAGFTALAAFVYFTLPMRLRTALARLVPMGLAILLVGGFSLIVNPWQQALASVLRLSALMLAAAAITAATSVPAFIDTITRAARPLEKTGLVRAADIGLAVGLVIRFVPDILSRYGAIRDAHRARGIRFRPRGAIVPLIILTLRDADSIADAIDARGIRGEDKRNVK